MRANASGYKWRRWRAPMKSISFFSFFGIRRFVVLNGWLFYLEVCYLELKQLFWTFFTFFFYTVHNLISEMTVFDKPQSFWNAFYFQNKLVAAQHFLSIMRQKMWPNYKLRSSKITEKCNLVSKRSPFSQPNSLFGLPESAVGGLRKAIMKGARKKIDQREETQLCWMCNFSEAAATNVKATAAGAEVASNCSHLPHTLRKVPTHSVGKQEIHSHQENISWNQLSL